MIYVWCLIKLKQRMRLYISSVTYLYTLETPISLQANIKAVLYSESLTGWILQVRCRDRCVSLAQRSLWQQRSVCLEEKPRNEPDGYSVLSTWAAYQWTLRIFMKSCHNYGSQPPILALPWLHCLLHLWKLNPSLDIGYRMDFRFFTIWTTRKAPIFYQPYTKSWLSFWFDFVLPRVSYSGSCQSQWLGVR